MEDYKLPVMQQPTPHPLPRLNEDLTKLLDCCDNNNKRALVALLGLEGMRLHEALGLNVTCIDTKEMTIYVNGKGGKVRILPITERAFTYLAPAYLDSCIAGKQKIVEYSDRGARLCITDLGRRAQITREISSHDLRATFATLAYQAKKDIRLVQYWMGHGSIVTTQRYIGFSMEDLKNAGSF
jgi:site-specific recombinase XerD